MLLIPQRAGFRPLVRGDFDHSYSPLLRLTSGKGSATFCTFDFEGRVGTGTANDCPAAAAVASATFREFLADDSAAEAPVFVHGGGGVLIVGGSNATVRLRDVRGAVGNDGRALLLGCDALAAEAGLKPSRGTMSQVVWKDDRHSETSTVERLHWHVADLAFVRGIKDMADVGPSLLRLREGVPFAELHPAAGWKVDKKGAIAVSDDGRIVFDQIPLYSPADRARAAKDWVAHRNWSQSQDNQMRRHALLLGKWGVPPSKSTLARALHLAAEDEKSKDSLYWSENDAFDPFLFIYW